MSANEPRQNGEVMSIAFDAATALDSRETDAIAQPVFSGLVGASPGLKIDIQHCDLRSFRAATGELIVVTGDDGPFQVLIGLGDSGTCTAEMVRKAAGSFAREIAGCAHVAFDLRGVGHDSLAVHDAAKAVVEGMVLAAHRFPGYRRDVKASRVERVTLLVDHGEVESVIASVAQGVVISQAVNLARDLANEPAGVMTPERVSQVATQVARQGGLDARILDEEDIALERLGGLLGVGQGSHEPSRLVILTYEPSLGADAGDTQRPVPVVALVGKGITFDSGGLSLKSAAGMTGMKADMSGGAAVIAVLGACRALAIRCRVVGIVPLAENMPGGGGMKPGDVVRIRNGKTIEVLNTDAEGRLVLADGLVLAAEERPDAIIDLATLTKDCVVALGPDIAGVMGNNEELIGRICAASERAGEFSWHLPLPEQYRSHIDSDVADMKNTGVPGQAGALTAGLLLSEFVGDCPWAHLDIVGRTDVERDYRHKGALGFGVRTLLELFADFDPLGGRSSVGDASHRTRR